jgi:hypothetical protein
VSSQIRRPTPQEAAAFNHAATEVIRPHGVAGWLELTAVTEVSWGTARRLTRVARRRTRSSSGSSSAEVTREQ